MPVLESLGVFHLKLHLELEHIRVTVEQDLYYQYFGQKKRIFFLIILFQIHRYLVLLRFYLDQSNLLQQYKIIHIS